MSKTRYAFLAVLMFVVLTGLGCKQTTTEQAQQAAQPITLEFWRVFDGPDSFSEIINAYNASHPSISINYRRLRFDEYEQELLNAFAEDRGPDIFSVHNTWMQEYQPKLLAQPDELSIAFTRVTDDLARERITEIVTRPSLTLRQLREAFADVVYSDVVLDSVDPETGQVSQDIYGLPMALDTMVLYYNKSLLNNAGIPQPPRSWSDFQSQVKDLTRYDSRGDILLSGAAIGTANNINRSPDILALLMMQNGAEMIDDNGSVRFHLIPDTQPDRVLAPGLEALNFYTDFASPIKDVYTWNDDFEESLDAFIAGKTAFFFGYAFHKPIIDARAPKLNYEVSEVPQIAGNPQVNIANYWIEGVSRKTEHPNEAWDFIEFAVNPENVTSYLERTQKPTALRSLLPDQENDLDLAPFASQVLTARSWYIGDDAPAMEEIFRDMINDVLDGRFEENFEALELAAGRVQGTISK